MDVLSWPWGLMAPEFTVLGVATLLSLIDLFLPERNKRTFIPYLGILGILAALVFVLLNIGTVDQIMNDMYRVDGFSNLFKIIILSGVALVFIMSIQTVTEKVTSYRGEYYYLMLAATLGAMMMASSGDLITLFIGMEILSISSYILVGIRKTHLQGSESAFKYAVNGSVASAILLFGMSYLYGITGSTNLQEIVDRLTNDAFAQDFGNIAYIAFFLVFVGLSFKIAAAPFHMWAPDVYQGAPTPVTAFLSVVSKVAGFAIVARIFFTAFAGAEYYNDGMPVYFIHEAKIYIAILAAATMIIGNVMALRQTNIKRMMAYSSIAQAGYLLVPIATVSPMMLDYLTYYLIAYLLMNLGMFAILAAVTKDRGSDDITSFAGLYHRAPFTAIAMSIFMISLAGIPITAGFFGKFYIFIGSIWEGNYWLAAVMIATSVISYYYYFGVMRQMYMRTGETEAKLRVPVSLTIVLLIGVVGTLLGGIYSDEVIGLIREYFYSPPEIDPYDTFMQMFR